MFAWFVANDSGSQNLNPEIVRKYRIGQLYMIAKHSHEQSEKGEGVEVVKNEPCEDAVHGKGQLTEKRIYLSSRLPSWIGSLIPNIFYITEKAWNYYPYTITEYTCLKMSPEAMEEREVDFVDIAYDEIPPKYYKEEEDPTKFKSIKTSRGPLEKNWRDTSNPVMCSYKLVRVKFEVWGLQTKVESFTHRAIRDILLAGHRQAFAWIDEWHGMTIEDIRNYENKMHQETNKKLAISIPVTPVTSGSSPATPTNTPTETSPPCSLEAAEESKTD